MKLFKLTTYIFSKITFTERYNPNFKWEQNNWIHNIFRFYEMVFGRRFGIKAEGAVFQSIDEKGNKLEEIVKSYSFENNLAIIEYLTRRYLSDVYRKLNSFNFDFFDVLQPEFALAGMSRLPKTETHPRGGYSFSIANVGAAAAPTQANQGIKIATTATATISRTVSGSDTILFAHVNNQNTSGFTTFQDNGNNFTDIDSQNDGGVTTTYAKYIIAPTSGTANVVVTRSATTARMYTRFAFYSGAAQSSQPDSGSTVTKGNNPASSPVTVLQTTVADNCWNVLVVYDGNGGNSAGTGSTSRCGTGTDNDGSYYDSNTAKTPAGQVSMAFNGTTVTSSTNYIMFSFAPTATATTNSNFLSFM